MANKTETTQFDLEYFFELSPDLLCVAGYDGYFKKINPAVSKTLGFSNDELFESPIADFLHPEDRELSLRKLEEIRTGKTLFQFENRFLSKDGAVVWLHWTSVPIARDKLIFGIAKDITYQKKIEDNKYVQDVLSKLNTAQMQRFSAEIETIKPALSADESNLKWMGNPSPVSQKDQIWLNKFEALVRHYAGKREINLRVLSSDMAMSERQLFRQVNRIMGITPNKLVLIIRLHLAWEAIASRKYETIDEISNIAGYSSKTHFKRLFNKVYGIDVSELL